MKHKHISVLILLVFGAAAAYPQITLNSVPERAVGTPALTVTNANPNLVEGREFYAPQAVALDNSISPPILYVSDYANNRVLAWRNAATFTSGQKADLAIGQPDRLTTFAEGPSASQPTLILMPTTGLTRPSGIAVDASGNLYVADGGNNRVLRYPKPFAQTGQYPVPDLWIGQATLSGHIANYPTGTATPTAQGLDLNNGGAVPVSNLAFDSSWNLWVVDTGNARILRFNASALAGTGGGLTADLELGQPSLTSNSPGISSSSTSSYYVLNQFISPSALGFDPGGNLFVGDFDRGLVFVPPFSSGMSASPKILGIYPNGYTFPTGTTPAAEQAAFDQAIVAAPAAFFFLSGSASGVGVVDAGYNRIMIFPAFANWPAGGIPPSATAILGQSNACTMSPPQSCKLANNGSLQGPSNTVFYSPAGVAYTGTELFLADAGNNRLLDLPQTGGTSVFGPAARVLGQDYFTTYSPNLIEGREFQFAAPTSSGEVADAAMVIDDTTGTPHLYVSDPFNNRVLGFRDMRKIQNGATNKADIVLGQADFTTALANYPSGDPTKPTSSSLYHPVGLVADGQGNLYVADSANGRVLRFPAPFAYAGLEQRAGVGTGAAPEPADLVLGQQNFTSQIFDPTAATMRLPYGLAITPACDILNPPCVVNGLVVSDQYDNRVLYFPASANGTFAAGSDNGKAATVVFGQTSFNSIGTGSTAATMSDPHHVASDSVGNVYVADSGNNRILIFPDPHSALAAPTGAQAPTIISTGLSSPEGVFVNPHTLEIWVANTGQGVSLRYANLQSVQLGLGTYSSIAETSGGFPYHPLAVTQDQYGDLLVADDAHRVAMYYPGLNLCNGASYLPASPPFAGSPSAYCLSEYDQAFQQTGVPPQLHYLAPGTVATIYPCASPCPADQFGDQAQGFQGPYPVPTSMLDVQVLFDGVPSPIYYVGGPLPTIPRGQINFIIPNGARTSGYADLQVVRVSTGQILGAAQVPMTAAAPGAFIYPQGQTGATLYAAAINQDGSLNAPANCSPPLPFTTCGPVTRGQAVSLYMTGQGHVPGLPSDGVPATAPISAPVPITVLLNGIDVNGYPGESGVQHILYSGIDELPGMWQINVLIPKTVSVTSGVGTWFAVIANGVSNWDSSSGFKTYIYVK